MTDPERRLVDLLKARQQQLGMLDMPFSQHLGISQPHWSLVKRGKRRIGRQMAIRTIAVFPELWREVQEAMLPREGAA